MASADNVSTDIDASFVTPPKQPAPRRARSRKACEPCRERKRKCDGEKPCGACVRYEYDCHYVSVRALRKQATAPVPLQPALQSPLPQFHLSPSSAQPPLAPPVITADAQLQPADANSGAAFVRKLAMGIDPANAPRLHLFAWNLYLGSRAVAGYTPRARPLTDILSRATMESLVATYMAKVDPCYGFIDREVLFQRLQRRWLLPHVEDPYDAVLCGVAALGYLFTHRQAVAPEIDLLETAKRVLDQASDSRPDITVVTGWLLRVAYMRITASPHKTWINSCHMLHIIEACRVLAPYRWMGWVQMLTMTRLPVCIEIPRKQAMLRLIQICNAGYYVSASLICMRERILSFRLMQRSSLSSARHINVWTSFDLGHTRVSLPHIHSVLPAASTPEDYSLELFTLLPLSEKLDPDKPLDVGELQAALVETLSYRHTAPPSVLTQTNLMLCICRRLRLLDFNISGELLEKVLTQTSKALKSAQTNIDTGSPWHHDANVPFQIVCILLAIDNPLSIAQLGDAVRVLNNVVHLYDTDATREALSTASLLIVLHQRRKEADAKSLTNILRTYAPSMQPSQSQPPSRPDHVNGNAFADSAWLGNLVNDMPNLQGFDMNTLFDSNGQWDVPVEWLGWINNG